MAAEPEETRALAVRPQAAVARALPDRDEWQTMMAVANALAKARGFIPAHFGGDAYKVLAAIMYGRDLGLSPTLAIQNIIVIDGKATANAQLMGFLIRRAGHRLTAKVDGEGATVTLVRTDDGSEHQATFTLAMAKRAGLVRAGGAWEKYPEAMCYARALTMVARMGAQDALMGVVYTPEELGADVDQEGNVLHLPKSAPIEGAVREIPMETGEIAPEAASAETKAAVEAEGQAQEEVASPTTSGEPASSRRRGVGPKPRRTNVVSGPRSVETELPPSAEPSDAVPEAPPVSLSDEESPTPANEEERDALLFELRQRCRRQAAKLRRIQITLRNKRSASTGLPKQDVPTNDDATSESDESLQAFIESRTPGKKLEELNEDELTGLLEALEGLTGRKEAELGAPPQ